MQRVAEFVEHGVGIGPGDPRGLAELADEGVDGLPDLPRALERGIGVIANRNFREGRLTRTLARHPLPGWAGDMGATSWAQLILKFVVSHPAVTCAIPATRNVTHVRENLAAAHGVLPDARTRERIARTIAAL